MSENIRNGRAADTKAEESRYTKVRKEATAKLDADLAAAEKRYADKTAAAAAARDAAAAKSAHDWTTGAGHRHRRLQTPRRLRGRLVPRLAGHRADQPQAPDRRPRRHPLRRVRGGPPGPAGRPPGRPQVAPGRPAQAQPAGLPAVPPGVFDPAQDPGPGPPGRDRRPPGHDAPVPDRATPGQGPVHDRRSGRPRGELRLVHAPRRPRREARHEPHLDRAGAHRKAARRLDRAHGNRDPEVPAESVQKHRGLQPRGRRGGRAVPGLGDRQLPDQLHVRRRPPARERHGQRPRPAASAPWSVGTRPPPSRGTSKSRTWSRVAFNLAWDGHQFQTTDPAFAPFPLTLDLPPDQTVAAPLVRRVGEESKTAARVEVPFEFIAPRPGQVLGGPARPRRSTSPSAGPGRPAGRTS